MGVMGRRVVSAGVLAACMAVPLTFCKGSGSGGTAVGKAFLEKAAGHYGVTVKDVEGDLECSAKTGGDAVAGVWQKDVKDGGVLHLIRRGGNVVGPGEPGYGPGLAFAACGIADRLPDEAALAAGIFMKTSDAVSSVGEALVRDLLLRQEAADGRMPSLPSASIIDGGWNLTFWTSDIDRGVYRRYKVFVMRDGKVDLAAAEEIPYRQE